MTASRPVNKAPWPDRPLFLVDDDVQWLTILTKALRSLGWYQVRSLSDPSYAVQLASEFRPAAVLLDLVMANRDGRQVLKDLHSAQPDLPIIVITGVEQVDAAVTCMRGGATDFLTKPLARADLEMSLRRAVVEPKERQAEGSDFQTLLSEVAQLPNFKSVPDMLIEEALRRSGGVVKDAAAMLGISAQAICNRRRRASNAA